MTLIAGIRGVRKSFIAADSRQFIRLTSGKELFLDNAQKWQQLGRHSMVAVAGDAVLAAFLIRKFADLVGNTPSYTTVKSAFDSSLELFAREYLTTINSTDTRCAILLSGYEKSKRDSFDAGRLGDVLGAGVRKHGEGVLVSQGIEQSIIEGMSEALNSASKKGSNVQSGSVIDINSPRSELTGYRITFEGRNVLIDIKEVDNFDAIFYGADSQFNIIKVPDDLLSEIYFRSTDGMDGGAIMISDAISIVAFMTEVIEERGYKDVGGNIFPVMVTPGGSSLYAGPISRLNEHTGETSVVRNSEVIDNTICYLGEDNVFHPYQTLFNLAEKSSSQLRIDV